ncbi:MAG: hydrolase 1, exosortase A system-associated [Bacillota bacterium]
MNIDERGIAFPCRGDWLYGVLSQPEHPSQRGVVLVVGGPQYRAGSHRQFTLLARYLAANGIAALRFDYRGMGDSDGMARTFENIDDDIRCAIDHIFDQIPQLREVVLWGLCDGASASLFYAHCDPRVRGLILLNPWIRTEQGEAKAYLRHYYAKRLFNADLWSKVFSGRFDYKSAVQSAYRIVGSSLGVRRPMFSGAPASSPEGSLSLPDRMLHGLTAFDGKVLLILSGKDLTAREFVDVTSGSRRWRRALESQRVQRRELAEANHTFSQRDWRDQVADWTQQWVQSW